MQTFVTVMELVRAGRESGNEVAPQHLHHAFKIAEVSKLTKLKPRRVLYDAADVEAKIVSMLGNARATNYVATSSKAAVYEAMLTTCFGYTAERLEAVVPLTTVGRSAE